MHLPLLLLFLPLATAFTIPAIFTRQQSVCLPPNPPKLVYIPFPQLEKLNAPKLPPLINSTIRLPSFRPKTSKFLLRPATLNFTDPHLNLFTKIAPNATQLFLRRQVAPSSRDEYPYNLMGKVIMRSGPRTDECTGTLVGTRIFVTANHCVSNRTGGWNMEFVAGFDGLSGNGEVVGAKECFGIGKTEDLVKGGVLDGRDYVVCVMERGLSEDVGYLGVDARFDDGGYRGRTWISAGYPGNFQDGKVLTLEDRVVIRETKATADKGLTMVSDPYVDHGWSGGPLFGVTTVGGEDYAFMIAVVSAVRTVSLHDSIFTSALHSGGYRLALLLKHARCAWGLTPEELDGCRR